MRLLQFLHPARPSLIFHWKFFIACGPVTPVGPATITDALLPLVFCDICSSSMSLSFESLDSILISNFHYYLRSPLRTRTRINIPANYHIFPASIAMKNNCFYQTSYGEEVHQCMVSSFHCIEE